MDEKSQVQDIADNMMTLADRLAVEGRFVDSAAVAGGVQVIKGLFTRLNPPKADGSPPNGDGAVGG